MYAVCPELSTGFAPIGNTEVNNGFSVTVASPHSSVLSPDYFDLLHSLALPTVHK
jgi:hypothetical protein